jgi:hypothetical protein
MNEVEDPIAPPTAAAWQGAVDATDEVAELADRIARESAPAANVEELAVNLTTVGPAVVQVARGQLGVCESGDNGGVPLQRYVHAFWPSSGPQPWCAFFVSWCYLQATGHKPPWQNPGLVASVEAWMQANGRLVSAPVHGDVFGVGGEHMGLVVGADPGKRQIWTVEGNTSSGCVRGNLRPWSGLWFGRL